MPDLPDWTGREALLAAPSILTAFVNLAPAGGSSTAQTIIPNPGALLRVRLFMLTVVPNDTRWQHWIAVRVTTIGPGTEVGDLAVGPNEPTDRILYSPPFEGDLNSGLSVQGVIQSGVVGDAEAVTVAAMYTIVSG